MIKNVRPIWLCSVEDVAIKNLVQHIKEDINPSLTLDIKVAHGGSVVDVLQNTLNYFDPDIYVSCCSIFDIDRLQNPGKEDMEKLQKIRQKLMYFSHNEIILEPLCVEGVLLCASGISTPNTSKRCKEVLAELVANKELCRIDKNFLKNKFPIRKLITARSRVKSIDDIFNFLENYVNLYVREDCPSYEVAGSEIFQ